MAPHALHMRLGAVLLHQWLRVVWSDCCYGNDFHFDMDGNGNVISNNPITPRTPEACCKLCSENPACKAFSLTNYNIGGWSTCVLKSQAEAPYKSPFPGNVYGIMKGVCTAGSYLHDGAVCMACKQGRFSGNPNSGACTECPAGTYNTADGMSTCEKCPLGKFNTADGLSSCSNCKAGTSSNQAGLSQCESCQPGRFAAENGASQCKECTFGEFSTHAGSTQCATCQAGKISGRAGSSTCENCQTGKFSAIAGSSKCDDCHGGYFSNYSASSSCQACQAGTISGKVGSSSCTSCLMGTFSARSGLSQCTTCSAGYINNQSGLSNCVACQAGTMSGKAGSSSCTSCLMGTFSARSGLSQCTTCSAGYINNQSGLSNCVACAPGKYSGHGGASFCQDCAPNYYSATSGRNACTKVSYTMAFIVGALVAVGMLVFLLSMVLQTRRTAHQDKNFRQGMAIWFQRRRDETMTGLSEIVSALAECYVMVAVVVDTLESNADQNSSTLEKYLAYAPKFFRPALLQFSKSTFIFEFYACLVFPCIILLVVVADVISRRKLTLIGVQKLASSTWITFVFDTVSIGVVKKLVAASLCEFSSSTTRPHLIMADYIPCAETKQVTMAIAGSIGLVIWYFWIAVLVRRKSYAHTKVHNLYDFIALTIILQAQIVFGVASAAFSKRQPKALLGIVFVVTILLSMLGDLTGGGPCRFTQVNRIRLVGTIVANLMSVLVFVYWLLVKESASSSMLLSVLSAAVCSWSAAIIFAKKCQRPLVECNSFVGEISFSTHSSPLQLSCGEQEHP